MGAGQGPFQHTGQGLLHCPELNTCGAFGGLPAFFRDLPIGGYFWKTQKQACSEDAVTSPPAASTIRLAIERVSCLVPERSRGFTALSPIDFRNPRPAVAPGMSATTSPNA